MNRTLTLLGLLAFSFGLLGCATSYPKPGEPGVSDRTYIESFSNYRQVYNTTYRVLNRYGVIRYAQYRRGLIVAELLTNREFFDKTRTVIYARIKKRGTFIFDPKYYDVEIRVVKQVDVSEPNPFSKTPPPYQWRNVHLDEELETFFSNQIKLALTRKAYFQKKPLPFPHTSLGAPPSKKEQKPEKKLPKKTTRTKTPKEKNSLKKSVPSSSPSPKKATPSLKGYIALNPEGTEDVYYAYLAQGIQWAQKGEWSLASIFFRSALNHHPRQPDAYLCLTISLLGEGRLQKAWSTLQNATQLPTFEKGQFSLVGRLFADNDEAELFLRRLPVEEQKHRLLRAFLLLSLGKEKLGLQELAHVSSSELQVVAQKLSLIRPHEPRRKTY